MAEGINIPITMTGADQVERAVAAFDNLSSTLKAARGSGKALEELRKLLVGLKGKSSALDELASSIKRMGDASANLERSMKAGFAGLGGVIQREMATVVATISTSNKKVEELARVAGVELVKVKEATAARVLAVEQQKGRAEVAQIQANNRLTLAAAQAGYKSRQSAQDAAQRQLLQSEAIAGRKEVAQIQANNRLALAAAQAGYKSQQAAQNAHNRQTLQAAQQTNRLALAAAQAGYKSQQAAQNAHNRQTLQAAQQSNRMAVLAQQHQNAKDLAQINYLNKAKLMALQAQIDSNYTPQVDAAITRTNIFTKALNALGFEANSTHSFIRGLASGFGALWLTWGKAGPMMAGAAMSMGAVKSFNVGAELESQLTMAENIGMAVDASGKKITNFKEIATAELIALSKQSTFSLGELSAAFTEFGRADLKGTQALDVLKAASNLALVGGTTLENASDMIMKTKHLFNLAWEDAGTIAAKIEVAANKYPMSVADIGNAMNYATEANARFGQSLETSLVVMGQLSKMGIESTKAGVAYNNWLMDLYGRTNASRKLFQELNKEAGTSIQLFDETGKHRDAIKIWEELAAAIEKVKKADPAKAARIQQGLMTVRGNRAQAAMGMAGAAASYKDREQLMKVSAADIQSKVIAQLGTAQAQLQVFKNYVDVMFVEIFEKNKAKFTTFFQNLIQIVDSPEFKSAAMSMITVVMALVTAFTQFIPVALQVGKALLAVGAGFAVLKTLTFVTGAVTALAGLRLTVYSLIGGLAAMQKAWLAFTAGLMVNPLFLAAAAITAVGTALYLYRDEIRLSENSTATLGDYFSEVGDTITGVLDMVMSKQSEAEIALENLNLATQNSATDQISAWESVLTFIGFMFDGFVGVVKEIGNVAAGVVAIVGAAANGVGGAVFHLFDSLGNAFSSAMRGDFASAGQFLKGSIDIESLKGQVSAVASGLGETFGTEFNNQVKNGLGATVESWSRKARERAADRMKGSRKFGPGASGVAEPGDLNTSTDKAAFLRGLQERAKVQEKLTNMQLLDREIREGNLKLSETELAQAKKWAAQADENERRGGGKSSADKEAKKAAAEAKRQQEQDQAAVDRYLKGLQDQISKVSELSTMEKLMVDIKEQGLKFSPQELELAKERATMIDARIAKEKEIEKLIEQQNAQMQLQHDIAKAQLELQNKWATRAMGSNAARVYTESANQNLDYAQNQERIRKKYRDEAMKASPMTNGGLTGSPTEYEKKKLEELMAAQRVELDQAYAIHQAKLQMIREQEALRVSLSQEGQAGIQAGFQDYLDTASNTYDQMRQFGTNTFNSISDAMTEFVTTGKANFADLAQSIINGLIKIYMQALISGFFKMVTGGGGTFGSILSGAFSAVFGGGGGGAAAGVGASIAGGFGANANYRFSTGGYTGAGGKYEPAGIVHRGEGVLSQENIKALGGPLAFMKLRNNLNSGRKSPLTSMLTGYSSGGLVGMPLAAAIESRSASVTNNSTQNTENTTTNGPTIQVTNHFTVGQNTSRQTQEQISSAIAGGLSRAQRRNG